MDRQIGTIRVTRFVLAHGVDVAVDPMAVEGQMDGGAVQSNGRALSEEVVIEEGRMLNPSLTTYLMPMAADLPSIHRKHLGVGAH